ncbi:MAG TPA: hypothetical protein VFK85_09470 [Anaeromyxobacteraceae bacterium]|nr:hypothetical protein [Anaeromyxobacteraceae bacterium]
MRRRPLAWAIAMVGAMSCPSPTSAGPPYLTDDPEPVALRHWEVYLSSASEFSHAGFFGTAPHVEVNYGAAPELQLHVIAPLMLAAGGGDAPRYGPGDVELGAKYRFLDEERAGVQIGAFPLVTLTTGSSDRGLGEGAVTALLPVWLQKSFGPWTTYGGAGYRIRTAAGSADTWFLGWQAQRRVGPLAIGAEVFHETDSNRTLSGATGFSVGTVVDFSPLHHLLVSIGEQDAGKNVIAYLGWQLTFGPASEQEPGTRGP